jgi:hypothetical protein
MSSVFYNRNEQFGTGRKLWTICAMSRKCAQIRLNGSP